MTKTLRIKVLPDNLFDCIVRDESGDVLDRFRETYKSDASLMKTISALREMTGSDSIKVVDQSEAL